MRVVACSSFLLPDHSRAAIWTALKRIQTKKENDDMKRHIQTYIQDEDGAITVDWVVLTAAIVGLAVAGVAAAKTGVISLAGKTASGISDENVE